LELELEKIITCIGDGKFGEAKVVDQESAQKGFTSLPVSGTTDWNDRVKGFSPSLCVGGL